MHRSYLSLIDFKKHTNSLHNLLEYLNDGNPYQQYTLEKLTSFLKKGLSNYREILIPKKDKDFRVLKAPNDELKFLQEKIKKILEVKYNSVTAPSLVHGYVKSFNKDVRTIRSNAEKHVGKKYVFNIDLENFFDSITPTKAYRCLGYSPIDIKSSHEIKVSLLEICFVRVDDKYVLPQGAPSSPILSNIACRDLDYMLLHVAKQYNQVVTRYADDITFSGNKDINYKDLLNTLTQRLKKHGFRINPSKVRLKNSNQRQIVTGLVVNTRVSPKKEYINETKVMLHNWAKHGLGVATERYKSIYNISDFSEIKFKNTIEGRIDFIGSILNGFNKNHPSPLYSKLQEKYTLLAHGINYEFISDADCRNELVNRALETTKAIKDKHKYPTKEYRFISYCNGSYLQIEKLIKYYLELKYNNNFLLIREKIYKLNYNGEKIKKDRFAKKRKSELPSVESENYLAKKEEVGLDEVSKKVNRFMHFKNEEIERAFMKESFRYDNYAWPRYIDFIRKIRNAYSHGKASSKYLFNRTKQDFIREFVKDKNYDLDHIRYASRETITEKYSHIKNEVMEFQFRDWFESYPFDDVKRAVQIISDKIKELEEVKKRRR